MQEHARDETLKQNMGNAASGWAEIGFICVRARTIDNRLEINELDRMKIYSSSKSMST